tara:strand:- start:653 stop:1444 length:792 start_codon:yes stop_codon:yes gene_type:complete
MGWGRIFFLANGGGGGGADTNLGNTDLTADANRSYDVDGNILEFVNGAVDVFKVDGSTFKIGVSGSEYTMPNAKSGTNGEFLMAAGTLGDTAGWVTTQQELMFSIGGVIAGGLAARTALALPISGSTIINIGAAAAPTITNPIGGAGVFMPDVNGDFDGIDFCITCTFEGSIAASSAIKFYYGKATTSSGVGSFTFTKTLEAVATSLLTTVSGDNILVTGSLALPAGAGMYIFGIQNSVNAALNTGNISVSGWVRFKKSLVTS